MKAGIHPTYQPITITCACGNSFEAGSTLKDNLRVEICSNCHPLYTGKSKLIDTAGRVDKFRARMEMAASAKASKTASKSVVTESAPTPQDLASEEAAIATEEMPAIEMAAENAAESEVPQSDESVVAEASAEELAESETTEAPEAETTQEEN